MVGMGPQPSIVSLADAGRRPFRVPDTEASNRKARRHDA
jgi:hypothetical protein